MCGFVNFNEVFAGMHCDQSTFIVNTFQNASAKQEHTPELGGVASFATCLGPPAGVTAKHICPFPKYVYY